MSRLHAACSNSGRTDPRVALCARGQTSPTSTASAGAAPPTVRCRSQLLPRLGLSGPQRCLSPTSAASAGAAPPTVRGRSQLLPRLGLGGPQRCLGRLLPSFSLEARQAANMTPVLLCALTATLSGRRPPPPSSHPSTPGRDSTGRILSMREGGSAGGWIHSYGSGRLLHTVLMAVPIPSHDLIMDGRSVHTHPGRVGKSEVDKRGRAKKRGNPGKSLSD